MMAWHVLAWLLCLLFIDITEEGTPGKAVLPTFGSATPLRRSSRAVCSSSLAFSPLEDDLYWFVGGQRQIWCSVLGEPPALSVHSLAFFKNTEPLPFQVVNETTIAVTLNLTEAEEYKVFCSDSNGHMCMAEVNVGYAPLPLEKVECVSHNWDYLTCSWKVPDNPVQEANNQYLPYLVSTQEPSDAYMCSCHNGNDLLDDSCSCLETCCLWAGSEYNKWEQQLTLMFLASNPLGTANFTYLIDNYAVVLPAAMSSVSIVSLGKRLGAAVTWTLPPPMGTFADFASGILVRVDYRLAQGDAMPWISGELLPCKGLGCKNGYHNFSLPYWWSHYEVRVRLRSAAAPLPSNDEEDGWWSDSENYSVNTSSHAPDKPPGVSSGTFQVVGRGFPGLCDLVFSWGEVPPHLHNGPDFAYHVQLCRSGEVLAEVSVSKCFTVFRNVSIKTSYTLRVAATNSEGRSDWAEMEVIGERPTAPLVPVVVVHNKGLEALYELRWRPGAATHHTAYLCLGGKEGDDYCMGQLYWVSVPTVPMVAINLTLQDFGLKDVVSSPMIFGLSHEDDNGTSSGVSLARCSTPRLYSTAHDPPQAGKPLMRASWVELPWSLEWCKWAGVVEEVEATYCPGIHRFPDNCTETRRSVSEGPWTTAVVVTGLRSGQQITAWLKLHYRGGSSQWSESVTFTTSTAGVEGWLVAVVAAVGVAAAVLLLVGLAYGRRKIVDNLKKLRLQPSLPSGLVPEGLRDHKITRTEKDTRDKDGARQIGVSRNTVSASVKNPGYSHILPTAFGRRPSSEEEEEESRGMDEVLGRKKTQGDWMVSSQQQRLEVTKSSALINSTDALPPEGTNMTCDVGLNSTQPLLVGSSSGSHYITPYFSESESEMYDTSSSVPLCGSSRAELVEADKGCNPIPTSGNSVNLSGGDSIGGGGYMAFTECVKEIGRQADLGYVTAQHGNHIAVARPGYVLLDAFPHNIVSTEDGDDTCPAKTQGYVGLDFPGVKDESPLPKGMSECPHHSISPCQEEPIVAFTSSLHGVLNQESRGVVNQPAYLSLPETLAWQDVHHPISISEKCSANYDEAPKEVPASGYVAIQFPHLGQQPGKEDGPPFTRNSQKTQCLPDPYIPLESLLPPNSGQSLPCYPTSTTFPAIIPAALNSCHTQTVSEEGVYFPLSSIFSYKDSPFTEDDLSLEAPGPSSSPTPQQSKAVPEANVTFAMLSCSASSADKADFQQVKETEESGCQADENQPPGNGSADDPNLEELPAGYSRVGEH